MALVTIARFDKAVEAHLAKAKLESEGIECFVADENLVTLNWLYAQAVGGIKLRVDERDAAQAQSLLFPETQPDYSLDLPAEVPEESDPLPRCPYCGAEDIRYEKISHGAVLFFYGILGVPFPRFRLKGRWACQRCFRLWKSNPPPAQ